MSKGLVAVVLATAFAGSTMAQPAPAASFDALAVQAAAGELPRLRSLLVGVGGNLVFERYFHGARATTPANIKSASKSIISALVGIAIDRRLLDGVDQPIGRFF